MIRGRSRGRVERSTGGVGRSALGIELLAVAAMGVWQSEPALAQTAQQAPEPVTVDIGRCVELQSREAQIACYLAEIDATLERRRVDSRAGSVAAATTAATTAAAAAAAAPAAAAPATSSAASAAAGARAVAPATSSAASTAAGARAVAPAPETRQAQDRAVRPVEAPPPATSAAADFGIEREAVKNENIVDEIQGTVASLRETLPNSYVVTLEDGQIWRQRVPARYPLSEGDVVRIFRSRFGDYRLQVEERRGFIRVERVQ